MVGTGARLVPRLSYMEAAEMAHFGAEVIHPKTMQPVRRAGYEPTWKRVDTAGTLTAALSERSRGWDAVTCDDAMAQLRYLSALHLVRALQPGIPFILVSNAGNDAHAAEALLRDGYSVVSKNRLEDLPALIARALHASLRT
jgi:DNA-binding NtrC family response regulator